MNFIKQQSNNHNKFKKIVVLIIILVLLFMMRVLFYANLQHNTILHGTDDHFQIDLAMLEEGQTAYLEQDWQIEKDAEVLVRTITLELPTFNNSEPLVLMVPPSEYIIKLKIEDELYTIEPNITEIRPVVIEQYNQQIKIVLEALDVESSHYVFYKKLGFLTESTNEQFMQNSQKLEILYLVPLIINVICAILIYLFIVKSRLILITLTCFALAFLYEFIVKMNVVFALVLSDSLFTIKSFTLLSAIFMLGTILLANLYFFKQRISNRFLLFYVVTYSVLILGITLISYEYFPIVQFTYLALFTINVVHFIYILATSPLSMKKASFIGLIILAVANGIIWQSINSITYYRLLHYPIDYLVIEIGIILSFINLYTENVQKVKQIAEQLKQANQLKDNFLRENTETLNKPFHKMMALTKELSEGADEQKLDILRRLKIEQKNAYFIMSEKLEYVKFLEGDFSFEKKKVELSVVIRNVVELLQELIEANNVHLQMKRQPGAYYTIGDEQRFGQIYYYILRLLIIENYGRNTNLSIFEKDDTIYTICSGYITTEQETITSSISYYVCKELIIRQGGQLQLSLQQNQLTVTIQFPKVKGDDYLEQWKPLPTMKTNRPATMNAILFLTEDVSYIELGKTILGEPLYYIDFARYRAEIEEKLFSNKWDLLIIDSMLSDIQSNELIRWVRLHFSMAELPIIHLTWRIDYHDLPDTLALCVNDYLIKPLIPTEFKYRVMNLLRLKTTLEEQHELEHSLLRAQIEPHFLYNTLNAIASLSEIDQNEMIDLLHHFGNYLQSLFNKKMSQRVVPIKTELSLVESYAAIEKLRFAPNLFVVWEIDESINVYVPPFAIQTLVENAIRHGIRQKDGPGTVCIIVQRDEQIPNLIQIQIADDGVGMSQTQIKEFLNGEKNKGIGLYNTDSRLKRIYGEGLQIISEVNDGTVVSFTVDESKSYI